MSPQSENVDYGDLLSLIGCWEGVKGWNVIAVPAVDAKSGSKTYKLMVQNYYETLTFDPINDPVLNEGGSVDQIIGALKYQQLIHEFESNSMLHDETGMMFYLDTIKSNTDAQSSANWQPPFSIARTGSIPHGNSMMILGDSKTYDGNPEIPAISTYPALPDSDLQQYRDQQARFEVADIVTQDPASKIFDVKDPNHNLIRDNKGLEILETTHISLDSQNSGGIVNLPFINKFANTTRAKTDFWLQKARLPMANETFTQLQYSQVVDLEFEVEVEGRVETVSFPHVTTNTLQRKP